MIIGVTFSFSRYYFRVWGCGSQCHTPHVSEPTEPNARTSRCMRCNALFLSVTALKQELMTELIWWDWWNVASMNMHLSFKETHCTSKIAHANTYVWAYSTPRLGWTARTGHQRLCVFIPNPWFLFRSQFTISSLLLDGCIDPFKFRTLKSIYLCQHETYTGILCMSAFEPLANVLFTGYEWSIEMSSQHWHVYAIFYMPTLSFTSQDACLLYPFNTKWTTGGKEEYITPRSLQTFCMRRTPRCTGKN